MDGSRKRTLRDTPLNGRRVFCRVDFNVPLEQGRVADETRIVETLPTLRALCEAECRVVVASHLGRPKGRPDPLYSLRPVAERLKSLLGRSVGFSPETVGPEAEARAQALAAGECLLLENLRFHPGEEANDPEFAGALAGLAEAYVNDAFGAAHRAHASVVGVPQRLKPAVAGLLMERELLWLGRLLESPERPFAAILGGAKVSDKIEVVDNLLPRIQMLLIGGAMAYTFLAAQGVEVGRSRVEAGKEDLATKVLEEAERRGVQVLLPLDHVAAAPDDPASVVEVDGAAIPRNLSGMDIGPRTVEAFVGALRQARTILWNGPLGRFEVEPFHRGTEAVARALADLDAVRVLGGGDTAAAARRFGIRDRVDHVSTGGGAALALLAGRRLPGVEALDDAP